MKFFGKTDIGLKRKNNQDSFAVISRDSFFTAVVCDGMGGAQGGNVAGNLASRSYSQYIKAFMTKYGDINELKPADMEKLIKDAAEKANFTVFNAANADNELEGMGTTLVSVFVCNGSAFCANIGDSRCYAMKNGKIKQITTDHSFVQYLIDKGSITAEQAKSHPNKNIILKALGVNEGVETDVFKIKDYDMLLLCSDGLTNHLSDNEIAEILNDNTKKRISLKRRAEALINSANQKGGLDNITAVLITK